MPKKKENYDLIYCPKCHSSFSKTKGYFEVNDKEFKCLICGEIIKVKEKK